MSTIKKYEQLAREEGGELATHGIAKGLLECGVEIDIIMKSTGLTREALSEASYVPKALLPAVP